MTVNANLFQGNQAGAGSGGGVSIAGTLLADKVVLTNNMMINNVAGYAGAVALSGNTGSVRLVNNTVASNVSTATTRAAFAVALGAPTNAQIAGIALLDGAAPTLLNNILWGNRSYVFLTGGTTTALCNPGTTGLSAAGACIPDTATASYQDLGAVSPTAGALVPRYSVFTTGAPFAGNNNLFDDATSTALFEKASTFTDTLQSAVTVDEGGNFVNVIFSPLTLWDIDLAGNVLATPRADYHIKAASNARNAGRNNGSTTADLAVGANFVPGRDFDAQVRVNPVDIGADENFGPVPSPRVAPNLLAFSNVSVNTTKTLLIAVSNDAGAGANLVLAAPTVTGGFTFILGDCQIGVGMLPGTSCTMSVTFGPTAVGPQTGTLTVASNAPNLTVPLTGRGVNPTYTVTAAAAQLWQPARRNFERTVPVHLDQHDGEWC